MATSFTTWAALRTAVKDAIADYVAGSPCVGEYSMGGRTMRYRNIKELRELFEMTYNLENIENAGQGSTVTSYGRYSRY
jgi:hypothetical protein